MDYDFTKIPEGYDRGRDHGPEFLALWMQVLEAHLLETTITGILDLGCGTGRFSGALAACFGAEVVGLDPSAKMLARAREKQRDSRVRYLQGSAETVPLPSGSVDMIFMSMSFHHFRDRVSAARECRRVLRHPGFVFVRTGTREMMRNYPYVPFFPVSHPILEEVLPTLAQLREPFEEAGFRLTASEVIRQTIAGSWMAYADKLSTGGDSVLSRLSREDMDAGLAALRHHAAVSPDCAIVEPIDLLVFR